MHQQSVVISRIETTIVQPISSEDAETLWSDFMTVSKDLPAPVSERFYQWILENPKVLIMFYIGKIPSAWILRELNTTGETAELQGCIRKDVVAIASDQCTDLQSLDIKTVKRLVQSATNEVERRVMDETFFKLDRQFILIRFMENNLSVKGFALKWGFKQIKSNENNGNQVSYLLNIQDYIERRHVLFPTK